MGSPEYFVMTSFGFAVIASCKLKMSRVAQEASLFSYDKEPNGQSENVAVRQKYVWRYALSSVVAVMMMMWT
jgi:hypothetical protein